MSTQETSVTPAQEQVASPTDTTPAQNIPPSPVVSTREPNEAAPMVAAHIDLITKFDPNTKNVYHGPIHFNSTDMGKPSLAEVDYTLNEISKYLKWVSSNYVDNELNVDSFLKSHKTSFYFDGGPYENVQPTPAIDNQAGGNSCKKNSKRKNISKRKNKSRRNNHSKRKNKSK